MRSLNCTTPRFILYFLSLLCLAGPAYCWPTVYPTGTTSYNPVASYNSYILFAPLSIPVAKNSSSTEVAEAYLINMNGKVVHSWNLPFLPIHGRMLPNGNLVAAGQILKAAPNRPGFGKYRIGGATGRIVELTWEGKTVFSYEDVNMHHDFLKLPNDHYLYMAWERVPQNLQTKVRGGSKGTEFANNVMFNDYLVEIDRKGKVVWTWHANDHLDPNIDIIGPLYKRREWCHGNSIALLNNGNILLTSRSLDCIMVIEKSSGKIVSRWGTPNYIDKKTGTVEHRIGDTTLNGPHDGNLIPDGNPGAGHYLCYDNRMTDGDMMYSRVVEIEPVTGKIAWQSPMPTLGRKHFSDFMGGAQRLPNGNTLVCDGAGGRLFQMTSVGQVVWEYLNPFTPSSMFQGAIFRAHAYSQDYSPRFKELPPAEGPPVLLPPVDQLQAQETAARKALQNSESNIVKIIIGVIVAVAAVAVFAFQFGRRSIQP